MKYYTGSEALDLMKRGFKMKLPSWGGYWEWDSEKETIMIHCRPQDSDGQGDVLDIRETQRVEYTLKNMLSDNWVIADETNTPILGGVNTFDFGEALKYLKRGFKITRLGSEKNTYIVCENNNLYVCVEKETTEGVHKISSITKSLLHINYKDIFAEDWVFYENN